MWVQPRQDYLPRQSPKGARRPAPRGWEHSTRLVWARQFTEMDAGKNKAKLCPEMGSAAAPMPPLGPDGSSAPPSCCSQGATPAHPSGFPARLSPTRNCRLAASFPPLLLCQSLPPVAKPPRPSPRIPPVPFCFPLADSPSTLLPSTSPQHCVQYPTSASFP